MDNRNNEVVWRSGKHEKPFLEQYETVGNGIDSTKSGIRRGDNQEKNLPWEQCVLINVFPGIIPWNEIIQQTKLVYDLEIG